MSFSSAIATTSKKTTHVFVSLKELTFFGFHALRCVANIIEIMNQIGCCKGKASQMDILWPIFFFLF